MVALNPRADGSMSGSSAIIHIIQPWHTLVLLLKVLCYISHPGEIKISESQKHFLGRNYEEVKEKLKGLGFTNFVIKEMAMSKIGWGEKEECVAKIIIDDKAKFAKDTWFAEEAEVMIYYYVRV